MDKLKLTASYLYEKNDGTSDMTSQNNVGNPPPLPNNPNSKFISLNLKGTYSYNKNWSFTGGYSYQKYNHNDDHFDGYTNTIPVPRRVDANTSLSYLNG